MASVGFVTSGALKGFPFNSCELFWCNLTHNSFLKVVLFVCCCLAETNHYQFIYDFFPGSTCFMFGERHQDFETRSVDVQHVMCTDYLCVSIWWMNVCRMQPDVVSDERLVHVMLLVSVSVFSCCVPYVCSGLNPYIKYIQIVFFLEWIIMF